MLWEAGKAACIRDADWIIVAALLLRLASCLTSLLTMLLLLPAVLLQQALPRPGLAVVVLLLLLLSLRLPPLLDVLLFIGGWRICRPGRCHPAWVLALQEQQRVNAGGHVEGDTWQKAGALKQDFCVLLLLLLLLAWHRLVRAEGHFIIYLPYG